MAPTIWKLLMGLWFLVLIFLIVNHFNKPRDFTKIE